MMPPHPENSLVVSIGYWIYIDSVHIYIVFLQLHFKRKLVSNTAFSLFQLQGRILWTSFQLKTDSCSLCFTKFSVFTSWSLAEFPITPYSFSSPVTFLFDRFCNFFHNFCIPQIKIFSVPFPDRFFIGKIPCYAGGSAIRYFLFRYNKYSGPKPSFPGNSKYHLFMMTAWIFHCQTGSRIAKFFYGGQSLVHTGKISQQQLRDSLRVLNIVKLGQTLLWFGWSTWKYFRTDAFPCADKKMIQHRFSLNIADRPHPEKCIPSLVIIELHEFLCSARDQRLRSHCDIHTPRAWYDQDLVLFTFIIWASYQNDTQSQLLHIAFRHPLAADIFHPS